MPNTIANNEIGSSVRAKLNEVTEVAPQKLYRALISQSGASAPTATVLVNSLGGTVVWTRFSAGLYFGTLTGAFPAGKTFLLMSATVNVDDTYAITWTDANTIAIQTAASGVAADGVLVGDASIEIATYP